MNPSEGEQLPHPARTAREATYPLSNWVKTNGFILGLFAVVLLGFFIRTLRHATDGSIRIWSKTSASL